MKLVFDTNVFIEGLHLEARAKSLISSFEDSDHVLYAPSIVGFELFSGVSSRKSEQRKRIEMFLNHFEIVDLSWNIAKRAGEIFRSGVKNLETPDYIIAATALDMGAEVVTLNRRHFTKIPGVRVYDFD